MTHRALGIDVLIVTLCINSILRIEHGSQKLTRRHEGPSPKIWIRTKILSPSIRYFVAILWFVAIYALCIAYYTEFNLQICNYVQKRRICREISEYALDENLYAHFWPRRKGAKFRDLALETYFQNSQDKMYWRN